MIDKTPVPGLDPLSEREMIADEMAAVEIIEPLDVIPTATGAKVLCWLAVERGRDGRDGEA